MDTEAFKIIDDLELRLPANEQVRDIFRVKQIVVLVIGLQEQDRLSKAWLLRDLFDETRFIQRQEARL
jgi:hypothetical protein